LMNENVSYVSDKNKTIKNEPPNWGLVSFFFPKATDILESLIGHLNK